MAIQQYSNTAIAPLQNFHRLYCLCGLCSLCGFCCPPRKKSRLRPSFPWLPRKRSVAIPAALKAMARRACTEMGKSYQNSRLIVAHMGGGITVGAHHYGRVIDVNDATMGESPFTSERSGRCRWCRSSTCVFRASTPGRRWWISSPTRATLLHGYTVTR